MKLIFALSSLFFLLPNFASANCPTPEQLHAAFKDSIIQNRPPYNNDLVGLDWMNVYALEPGVFLIRGYYKLQESKNSSKKSFTLELSTKPLQEHSPRSLGYSFDLIQKKLADTSTEINFIEENDEHCIYHATFNLQDYGTRTLDLKIKVRGI